MAKSTPKTSAKAPAQTVKKKNVKAESQSPADQIVKICETALAKLGDLNIEHGLQSEINWCLGSFHNDNNPIGLYQMADRSLTVFKAELARKTKGVTAKFVSDIEKALKPS
ncbi:MAG TPA: hypothetical protein PLR06_01630 [Cyclobacteriaceae bacterium]|nr:hypothetical protein [Cyclobacteriaceae bacterium]